MAKAFLNISSWPFFFLESCQNLGKTLRKNNYSSEIYQVKPGYTIQKPANQLATQVNWMISIKPNPILETFRTRRTHQSLSDLRINKQDDDREMMTMQWKWLMVISMEVLGNHQIYSILHSSANQKIIKKNRLAWVDKTPGYLKEPKWQNPCSSKWKKVKKTQWYEISLAQGEYISQVL